MDGQGSQFRSAISLQQCSISEHPPPSAIICAALREGSIFALLIHRSQVRALVGDPCRSRGQHEAATHDRREAAHVTRDTEALTQTNAHGQSQYRDLLPCGAVPGAIAPGPDDAAAMHNLPQRDFRLNLRPGGARRLSEAGRRWAPITRQRATREERHTGLAWPTYCDKPKWAPSVMGGILRTVAHGDRRRTAETQHSHLRFSSARNRPLAVFAPVLQCR